MPPSPRPECMLAALLSSSEEGVVSFALDGTIQAWSRGAERLYGYTEEELKDKCLSYLLPLYEMPAFHQLLADARSGELPSSEEAERLHRDGSKIRLRLRRAAVRGDGGEVVAIVESARMLAGHSGNSWREGQLRSLLDQMPAILWTTDRSLRITSNWGRGFEAANVLPGELVGHTVYGYLKCQDVHAAPIAQHVEALRGIAAHFEYRHRNRDFEIRVGPLRAEDGEIIGCIGAGIDITERKRNEEQATYEATHDALTGLANYREFVSSLEHEIKRADRSERSFAVLLLDLDDLKRVNDQFGHLAGNRALQKLGDVLKQHCRTTDLAARYGGDEFAVLLTDADPAMARQIADRVEDALRESAQQPNAQYPGAQPRLTVSIGISVYPSDGRTAQELLETADQHLYRRKKKSRSRGVTAG